MKIELYMDIQEGAPIPQWGLTASTQPGTKPIYGYRRIKITAHVPDYVFTGTVDLEAQDVDISISDKG